MFANTPKLPYYAVIFSSLKSSDNSNYEEIAKKMVELVKSQDGFLGYESLRDENGFGITVSYWRDLNSIKKWKSNVEHKKTQQKGKELWYKKYKIRIAKVEQEYGFERL
jgi:heme-degrading monooxygenase HmoA